MTDYSAEGAIPVEDAAIERPPTVDEVLEEQRERDDLPDPSDDPHHQQVVSDAAADRADHEAEAMGLRPNDDEAADEDAAGAQEVPHGG